MTLQEISVRRFMGCLFNSDHTGIDNWEELYTKYIDLSGMGEAGQLMTRVAIHNLEVRLGIMDQWLNIQWGCVNRIQIPYIPGIEDLIEFKYGHRITWTGDLELFKKGLSKINAAEQRNASELKMLNKQLKSMEKTQKPETVDARNSFFTLLNIIGKHQGYAIHKDDTNMHEFALMVKDYNNEIKRNETTK